MKLHIISVGKSKESWLQEALQFYIERLQGTLTIEMSYVKDDERLIAVVAKEKNCIALDPKGKLMDSPAFAHYLFTALEAGGARLSLVIGGPDGLPSTLRETLPLISLSPLTMTHQLVRLVLFEQIYRASEIRRGSPYHRK